MASRSTISHSADSLAQKKKQEATIRLANLSRVYEHADRVLSGTPIKLTVVESGHAPAWSDGENIFINRDMITDFDIEELVQITGLNYHELAHQLYSPRRGTAVVKWVEDQHLISDNYLQAYNILEDQRIEALMVARYPAINPYLVSLITRWIGHTANTAEVAYLAMAGRHYLPAQLRDAFREIFMDPTLVSVIEEIANEYRTLAFPADYKVAQTLIQRFKEEVIDKLIDQGMDQLPDPGGCTHREPVKPGSPENGKKQAKDSSRAEAMTNALPEFTPPDEARKPQEPNEGGGPDINNAEPQPQEGGESLEGPPSKAPSGGDKHDSSAGKLPDNINEILDKIEAQVLSNNDVINDVKAKQKAIIGSQEKHAETIEKNELDSISIRPDVLAYSRRFARELEQLRQDAEPTWNREQPSGKLNAQRYLRDVPFDELFDKWEEGNDGTDMEVVILVDRSGSMSANHNDVRASEAMWVLKRSLESIDVPVTVYSFDTVTEVVYERDSKANRQSIPYVSGRGGTNPKESLLAAERLLKVSARKSKIMFIITDGDFNNNPNDDVVKRLRSMGVLTVMVLIADDREFERNKEYYIQNGKSLDDLYHHCEIFGNVATAGDLVPFARSIVTNTIKKAGRK